MQADVFVLTSEINRQMDR